MKARKIILTTTCTLLIAMGVKAGQPDSNQTSATDTVMPYQFTIIPPVGTNGTMSANKTNNISMNLIAGYNGGVEGIELGGFANVILQDVNGIQMAGFSNVVNGNLNGVQAAGFTNVVRGRSEGVMAAGFSNHIIGPLRGVQAAGFTNTALQSLEGGQASGFYNVVKDSLRGSQLSGFGNYAGNGSTCSQLAGFVNTNGGQTQGAQVAGFMNISGQVEGVQAAGFINLAKNVHGLQLGFINVADSFEQGIPVGFFSHVNSGYRKGLVQITEMQWIEGQYRTGVDRFHNIFSLAVHPLPGTQGWSLGYGVGSMLWQNDQSDITVDLMAFHMNEGELWTEAINNLIRLSGRYTYRPSGKRFGITAAPSLNLHTTSNNDVYGEQFDSQLTPYTLLEETDGAFDHRFWVGAQVGISF